MRMPGRPGRPRTNYTGKTGAAGVQSLSPRVRTAIGLYTGGIVKTKKAASAAAGLHPAYFTVLSTANPVVKEHVAKLTEQIDAETVDMATLLHKLSVKALGKIEETMDSSGSEHLRFKAAQDLADRGPQTTKVQRHQVESVRMDAKDVAALASTMVEAARIRQMNAHLAVGSHDKTGVSTPQLTSGE